MQDKRVSFHLCGTGGVGGHGQSLATSGVAVDGFEFKLMMLRRCMLSVYAYCHGRGWR